MSSINLKKPDLISSPGLSEEGRNVKTLLLHIALKAIAAGAGAGVEIPAAVLRSIVSLRRGCIPLRRTCILVAALEGTAA